jgi:hypothetical protein
MLMFKKNSNAQPIFNYINTTVLMNLPVKPYLKKHFSILIFILTFAG